MKFRIVLLAIFLTSAGLVSEAQTTDEEADAIITLLGVQKKEVVAKLVPVAGKDSVAFWKLYDEYQKENKSAAKDRIKLYERTAQAYANMTSAVADSLASKYFGNRLAQEKTLETYYKKIRTATNPIVAFEFYQAEVYLLTQIRAQIMSQVPTYGEIVRAAAAKKN